MKKVYVSQASLRGIGIGAMDEEIARDLNSRQVKPEPTRGGASNALDGKERSFIMGQTADTPHDDHHRKTFLERYGCATYQEMRK